MKINSSFITNSSSTCYFVKRLCSQKKLLEIIDKKIHPKYRNIFLYWINNFKNDITVYNVGNHSDDAFNDILTFLCAVINDDNKYLIYSENASDITEFKSEEDEDEFYEGIYDNPDTLQYGEY